MFSNSPQCGSFLNIRQFTVAVAVATLRSVDGPGVRAPSRAKDVGMISINRQLAHLIEQQHGLVNIRQLAQAGLRGDHVTRRVNSGHWTRVTSAVVRISVPRADRLSELWTAALHYDGAVLAGSSALEISGLPAPRDGVIHLIGTRTGRVAPLPRCIMHTQVRIDDADVTPDRAAVLPATVQVLKWARTDAQAAFQAIWPIQQRLVTLEDLQTRVRELPAGRGSIAARRRIALIVPGAHSVRELEFANGCRERGLPEPIRQRVRQDSDGRPRYTDAEFTVAGRSIIVEIDGMQHLDVSVRLDDDWRQNEFTLQGTPTLRISTLALRVDPDRVYAQLRRALQQMRAAA